MQGSVVDAADPPPHDLLTGGPSTVVYNFLAPFRARPHSESFRRFLWGLQSPPFWWPSSTVPTGLRLEGAHVIAPRRVALRVLDAVLRYS